MPDDDNCREADRGRPHTVILAGAAVAHESGSEEYADDATRGASKSGPRQRDSQSTGNEITHNRPRAEPDDGGEQDERQRKHAMRLVRRGHHGFELAEREKEQRNPGIPEPDGARHLPFQSKREHRRREEHRRTPETVVADV